MIKKPKPGLDFSLNQGKKANANTAIPSLAKRFGKAFILAEVAGFFGCYFLWRKLNRDQVVWFVMLCRYVLWIISIFQDFRLVARDSYPPLLETYYQIGETIDPDNRIREYDQMIWTGKRSAWQRWTGWTCLRQCSYSVSEETKLNQSHR